MKKILIFLTALFSVFQLQAQIFEYTYTYDGSGNRINRVCINLSLKSAQSIFDTLTGELADDFLPVEQHDEYFGKTQVTIYPNPNRGELVVKIMPFAEDIPGVITVTGMDGRVYYNSTTMLQYNLLDLTRLIPGNYILQMRMGDETKTYSIIKE